MRGPLCSTSASRAVRTGYTQGIPGHEHACIAATLHQCWGRRMMATACRTDAGTLIAERFRAYKASAPVRNQILRNLLNGQETIPAVV
jgi:hypothetical protein